MKSAVVYRAIAEEGDGDLRGLAECKAVASAGRLQDGRANDAAGAHEPDFGGE